MGSFGGGEILGDLRFLPGRLQSIEEAKSFAPQLQYRVPDLRKFPGSRNSL